MDLDALIAKVEAEKSSDSEFDLDALIAKVKEGREEAGPKDRAYYETSGRWLHGPWWESLGHEGPPYTWSDAGRYGHIIRGGDDPERSPRGTYTSLAWRATIKKPMAFWKKHIIKLLGDGKARTFNTIMVELANVTAEMAFTDIPDQALWELVGEWKVAHVTRPNFGGTYFGIPYGGETLQRIIAGRKDWYVSDDAAYVSDDAKALRKK